MADIRETRRRFTVLMTVLLAVDLAAAGVLISPIGRGARLGRQRLDTLWAELRSKDRDVIPLRGIDQKVVAAQDEITGFYKERLPSSYSSISEQLGKLAVQNAVQISTGRYDGSAAEIPGLTRVQIDAAITGDYVQVVKFINALERDQTFFLIDGVSLSDAQAGTVQLQLRLETYLRPA